MNFVPNIVNRIFKKRRSNLFLCFLQGEIDAHEDSFLSCAEAGEHLVSSSHYAADEVREKVSAL